MHDTTTSPEKQQENGILSCGYQSNLKRPAKNVALRTIVAAVRTNENLRKLHEGILAESGDDAEKFRKNKTRLPLVVPAVRLRDGGGRRSTDILGFTGFAAFDFDDCDDVDAVFERTKALPCCLCAFRSPSRKGIKAFLRMPKGTTPENYSIVHALMVAWLDREGIGKDRKNSTESEPTRAAFLCHDKDAYYNAIAETASESFVEQAKLMKPTEKEEPRETSEGAEEDYPTPEERARLRSALCFVDAGDRETWVRYGLAMYRWFKGSEEGYRMWTEWSRWAKGRENEDLKDHRMRWTQEFPRNVNNPDRPVTVGTIFHNAKANGWSAAKPKSVESKLPCGEVFDYVKSVEEPDDPVAVEGLLRSPGVMSITGHSKTNKTWLLCQLAACAVTKTKWLGRDLLHGNVLYVNVEMAPRKMRKRLATTMAKLMEPGMPEPKEIVLLNFRGYDFTPEELLRQVLAECDKREFAFMLLDPLYLVSRCVDENASSQILKVLTVLDKVCAERGLPLVYVDHSAKGELAERDVVDLAAGSASKGRFADAMMGLRKHSEWTETENVYVAEYALRDMPPQEKQTVRYDWPLFDVDDGTEAELKSGRKTGGGRKQKGPDAAQILAANGGSLDSVVLKNLVMAECGLKERMAFRRIQECIDAGTLVRTVSTDGKTAKIDLKDKKTGEIAL
jgi:hypothetical protein